jgi:hypothetical protein
LNEPALARATAGMNPESARIARALLNGVNFIARCAGKIDAMGSLLELEPDGVLEAWILAGCRRLRRNSATAGGSHPALDPLIEWSRFRARRGGAVREALRALSALRSLSRRETRRVLEAQQWNGAWGPDPGRMRALPAAQGDYLKSRLWQTLCRLKKLNRSLETTPGA